jgi:hypothetical protein
MTGQAASELRQHGNEEHNHLRIAHPGDSPAPQECADVFLHRGDREGGRQFPDTEGDGRDLQGRADLATWGRADPGVIISAREIRVEPAGSRPEITVRG